MPGGRLFLPPSALERLAYGEPDTTYCKQGTRMSDCKARIVALFALVVAAPGDRRLRVVAGR